MDKSTRSWILLLCFAIYIHDVFASEELSKYVQYYHANQDSENDFSHTMKPSENLTTSNLSFPSRADNKLMQYLSLLGKRSEEAQQIYLT